MKKSNNNQSTTNSTTTSTTSSNNNNKQQQQQQNNFSYAAATSAAVTNNNNSSSSTTTSASSPSSSSSTSSSQQQSSPSNQQQTTAAPQLPFTLENAIGIHVTLRTILDEEIQGEIYAYDPTVQILALCISGGKHESSTRKSFKVIKTNAISEVINLEFPQQSKKLQSVKSVPFSDLSIPLPVVNIDRLRKREDKNLNDRFSKLGVGVTSEAQYLFDSLSKVYPCYWDGDTIMALDIRISKPYGVNNVSGGNEMARNQIRKMLEGEHKKLQQRSL